MCVGLVRKWRCRLSAIKKYCTVAIFNAGVLFLMSRVPQISTTKRHFNPLITLFIYDVALS
jgi:hypothetical protein